MKLWGNSGILLDTQKETTEIIKVLDEYMTRHSDDVPESIIQCVVKPLALAMGI